MIRFDLTAPSADFRLNAPPALKVSFDVTVSAVSGAAYEGPYTLDPDFDGVTLPTKNKTMRDDVTVNPIEVARVSNSAGGTTIYIGGIIDG